MASEWHVTASILRGAPDAQVHLDKHLKLLDSPGIVFSAGASAAASALRNCVKVSIAPLPLPIISLPRSPPLAPWAP